MLYSINLIELPITEKQLSDASNRGILEYHSFSRRYLCPHFTRLRDIQLSFLRVNPLSDVSLLDTLTSFASVRRYAPFLSAFHLAVSSNAVEVRYAVVRFNRVGIKPTFCYCLLKRTS